MTFEFLQNERLRIRKMILQLHSNMSLSNRCLYLRFVTFLTWLPKWWNYPRFWPLFSVPLLWCTGWIKDYQKIHTLLYAMVSRNLIFPITQLIQYELRVIQYDSYCMIKPAVDKWYTDDVPSSGNYHLYPPRCDMRWGIDPFDILEYCLVLCHTFLHHCFQIFISFLAHLYFEFYSKGNRFKIIHRSLEIPALVIMLTIHVLLFFKVSASFRWSFGPNFAWAA